MSRISWCALFLSLLMPPVTMASYVNSCLLSVRVLEQPVNQKEATWKVKVLGAERNGRADSGCRQYINQVMNIDLDAEKTIQLKEGQRLRVRMLMTDSRIQPVTLTTFHVYDEKSIN